MTTIKDRVAEIRSIMDRSSIQALLVTGTDPHNSEYLPVQWEVRKWISGFTGSAGTVIITPSECLLWTDSRYYIQAAEQLNGTEFILMKSGQPECPTFQEWLCQNISQDQKVAVDGYCISSQLCNDLARDLKNIGARLVTISDPFGEIWIDRPAPANLPIETIEIERSGMSVTTKIDKVREFIKSHQSNAIILSALDEIAWTFNIRGRDISYNPVVISYAYISLDQAILFVNSLQITRELESYAQEVGITLMNYYHIGLFISELSKEVKVLTDPATLNFAIESLAQQHCTTSHCTSPIPLLKAIKNEIEISGFKKAFIQDGVAMCNFLYWLDNSISQQKITEISASERLTSFRAEQPDYVSDSFANISAYGPSASLPHYHACEDNQKELKPVGLYLIDSGGQYKTGTTDITRTVALGQVSQEALTDSTLALKGMIALSNLKFPKGTCGYSIDVIARQYLWQYMKNYGHGTGHGVGHYLNVHEGPQAIRPNFINQSIEPGMITSNEPAFYKSNEYGIRHENLLLCVDHDKNEYGHWYGFETLTLCPFDKNVIDTILLTEDEKEWLNNYHTVVYNVLSPLLENDEKNWLEEKCKAI